MNDPELLKLVQQAKTHLQKQLNELDRFLNSDLFNHRTEAVLNSVFGPKIVSRVCKSKKPFSERIESYESFRP